MAGETTTIRITKPQRTWPRGTMRLKNHSSQPIKVIGWQDDDKRPKSPPSTFEAFASDLNALDNSTRATFQPGFTADGGPDIYMCKHCRKGIFRVNASNHINACLRLKKEKAQRKKEAREARERAKEQARGGGDSSDDDIPATAKPGTAKTAKKGESRKRKADDDKASKSKKKKDEPKPKVPKTKGPVDVERQCGVLLPNGQQCARSLTCKSHAMGAKRAVTGRSMPYDMLLAAYQKKNQARQQKAALDANAPINDDEESSGPVDWDEETGIVMNALASWAPLPIVAPIPFMPVRREYQMSRFHEQMALETGGGSINIFAVD